ncbi:helix-turn-helix transcriptional regulator [Asticcacaulis sp. AND118]|uniref:ArsR/SmtB family transcription factor n=1 Tax=Asticcacaulis sp. AND118 TaxID=2840468 RepID=UPI001CFFCD57|nr:metalloregulator ArsR/SmtB family transcription factor [Asticcacaulis sp. AND118]UDF04420.1 metalloregulator ArsR/SmtB family transcription factor [Asticcacaulis sp. AND118]
MDKMKALDAMAALAQETRLDVFRLLVQVGSPGLPAGEIGERLRVRQNTMSANLSVLAQAGLIRSSREGRSIRYFADMDGVKGLLGFLMENCCGGAPEVCQPVIAQLTCTC